MPKVSATDNNDIIYIADLEKAHSFASTARMNLSTVMPPYGTTQKQVLSITATTWSFYDKYGRDKKIRVLTYKPFMDKKTS